MTVVKYALKAPAIGIEGDSVRPSPLRAAFERFSPAIGNFAPFFEALIGRLEDAAERQFGAEGQGPVAGKWGPLTAKYAERKLARWGAQPLLVASGEMRAQFTQKGRGLRVATDNQMAYGTSETPYASYHQTGTEKMIARPPMDLDEQFKNDFANDAINHTRRAWIKSDMNKYSVMSEAERADLDIERMAFEET
jgi:phage gpG-like protein